MSLHIGKQLRRGEDRATASEVVAALVDLLTEILVRLPAKSLLRFKSVSKKWLSLISSRRFCVLRSKRCCKHIRGLLLQGHFEDQPLFDFIPLHPGQIAPFESLKDGLGAVEVIQYCNGLLLCRSNFYPDFTSDHKLVRKYYVFNPTTRQQTTVNVNRFLEDSGKYNRPNIVNLAFDPRISPHYKLICSYMTSTRGRDPKYQYMFGVYSSENGLMTRVSDHLHTDVKLLTTQGIYWNGAIIWMAYTKESFHFNVDEKRFKKILYLNVDERLVGMLPLPPVADVTEGAEFEFGMYMTYFGVSNDHFYLIQTSKMYTLQFNVYDLDREYSGWFVRFRVDLHPVLRSFPEAVEKNIWKFGILAIVEKADDDDEKPFLVLSIRGKAIRFYLKDGSSTKICDFRAMNVLQKLPFYKCHDSILLVESLHPLPL